MNWYYEQDGQAQGPLAEDNLRQKVERRELPPTTLVWRVDLEAWQPIKDVQPTWIPESSAVPPLETTPEPATRPITKDLLSVKGTSPTPSRLKPSASAAKEAEPAEKKKGGGFLKRLFGGREG
jgi:hypothetical protein